MAPGVLGYFLGGPCAPYGHATEGRCEQEMPVKKERARLRRARVTEIAAVLGCLAAAFSALAALLVLLHH